MMLQTHSPQQPFLYEENGQAFDLKYWLGLLGRRILWFSIPFLLIATVGLSVVAIQRPIYRAEGEILVESPQISPSLVRPTVTDVADDVQVIQQRIMARDNLLAVVKKFNLFPDAREAMPEAGLVELMRNRVAITPVKLESQSDTGPHDPTIAFTLTFDYEIPDLAMRVANDLLTAILSEDASKRTNNATETTKFLEQEVKRLQDEHDAVVAQLTAIKLQPPDQDQVVPEAVKTQMKTLADLEAELVQKASVYSDEYPEVKNLKKEIAALKHVLAEAPQRTSTDNNGPPADVATEVLKQQQLDLEKNLEDANSKLTAARLGESMERGQQAERLQVLEQPSLPQIPVGPKRLKWYAIVLAAAAAIGGGAAFAAEMLDGSIRGSRELTGIIDRHLIVTIPYLSAPGEEYRRRRNFVVLCATLAVAFAVAVAVPMILRESVSQNDEAMTDAFGHLFR